MWNSTPIQLQRNCEFLVRALPSEINESVAMTVDLEKGLVEIYPATKRSSRAFGSALRISEGGKYSYQGANVCIGHTDYFGMRELVRGPTYVTIEIPVREIASFELRELIELLFDREIIVFQE